MGGVRTGLRRVCWRDGGRARPPGEAAGIGPGFLGEATGSTCCGGARNREVAIMSRENGTEGVMEMVLDGKVIEGVTPNA